MKELEPEKSRPERDKAWQVGQSIETHILFYIQMKNAVSTRNESLFLFFRYEAAEEWNLDTRTQTFNDMGNFKFVQFFFLFLETFVLLDLFTKKGYAFARWPCSTYISTELTLGG